MIWRRKKKNVIEERKGKTALKFKNNNLLLLQVSQESIGNSQEPMQPKLNVQMSNYLDKKAITISRTDSTQKLNLLGGSTTLVRFPLLIFGENPCGATLQGFSQGRHKMYFSLFSSKFYVSIEIRNLIINQEGPAPLLPQNLDGLISDSSTANSIMISSLRLKHRILNY